MAYSDPEKVDWSILIVIIIGTFMAVLNGSIVNVAIPKLMNIFAASPDDIQWVLSGYMMALGVVMPVSGYLADTFGYKRIYFLSMFVFIAGSALCGLAWSVSSLVGARVIQAIGGGIMQPLGMAFLYRTTPRDKIGVVLGIYGIAMMAAPAIGPTLGGYLVDNISWRLIFYINVPIGIINLFLTSAMLQETELIKGSHFDLKGLLLSVAGLFCLLLALSEGNDNGWSSPFIVSLIVFSIIALSAFVFNELKEPEPLLELRLFKNMLFTSSTIISSVINMALFGATLLMPLLLQNVMGLSAMRTGWLMLPAALATAAVMPFSGRFFDRYGGRPLAVTGLFILTSTTFVLSTFTDITPLAVITGWMMVRGMGMGIAMMPVTSSGMATIPLNLVGKASAVGNIIRQVAAALGVAMFTAIMQHRQVFHFSNLAQSLNFNSAEAQDLLKMFYQISAGLGWGTDGTQSLAIATAYAKITKMAAVQAIGDCFMVAASICAVALLMSFFLGDHRKVIRQADTRVSPNQETERVRMQVQDLHPGPVKA
jgi:DHA2 family multidrug resistance protein